MHKMLVSLVILLLGVCSTCSSEYNVSLRVSDTLSKEDMILLLSQQFQRALFADDNQLMRIKMREVFFPSLQYRYWHVDNIDVIDVETCITFYLMDGLQEKRGSKDNTNRECLVFRWTNSYLLNLINIRQITYFEFVTVGALFSMIAHGHNDRSRIIDINFTLNHNTSINSIEDTVIKQALIQFLSWCKLFARSETLPSSWDEKDQGFVTRKYDYTAVDLQLFDKLNKTVFIVTLTCFILCNALTIYILLKRAPQIYSRFCAAANEGGHRSSIVKGLLILAALVVSAYTLAVISAYSSNVSLNFTRQCGLVTEYGCIPEGEFPSVHRTQVMSLVSSFLSLMVAACLYGIRSICVIKTQTCSIFEHSRKKWIEVYLFWNVLTSVHLVCGLASIPLLMFLTMTPMYTIFFLSACTIGLIILLLPIAAIFHTARKIKQHTQKAMYTVLQVVEFMFVYLVGTGVVVTVLILYFMFLNGGASMAGVKGALYSLLPPIMISVVVFVFKRKTSSERVVLHTGEKQPLLINSVSDHL